MAYRRSTVSASAALLLPLLLTLSTATAQPSLGSSCEAFTTCSDCACSTLGYTLNDVCRSGCVWLPDLGACSNNGTTLPGPQIASLFMYPSLSKTEAGREGQANHDQLMCPLQLGEGVSAMLLIAVLCCVGGLVVLVPDVFVMGNPSSMGVATKVQQLLPSGSQPVAESVAEVPSDTLFARMLLLATHVLAYMSITIIWLVVGLPTSIRYQWGFGFFYPYLCICVADVFTIALVFIDRTGPLGREVQGFAVTADYLAVVHGRVCCRRWSTTSCALIKKEAMQYVRADQDGRAVELVAAGDATANPRGSATKLYTGDQDARRLKQVFPCPCM